MSEPNAAAPTETEEVLVREIDLTHENDEILALIRAHVASELAQLCEDLAESELHNKYTVEESLRAAKAIAEFNGEDPTCVFASMHDRIWFLKMTRELTQLRAQVKALLAIANRHVSELEECAFLFDQQPTQQTKDDRAAIENILRVSPDNL